MTGRRLEEAQVVDQVGRLNATELRLWCEAGWVVPAHGDTGPAFDEIDIARIRLVCELRDDLGLDEDAIPVVLSLVDQLYGLRRELRMLVQAVERQPTELVERLRAEYRVPRDSD